MSMEMEEYGCMTQMYSYWYDELILGPKVAAHQIIISRERVATTWIPLYISYNFTSRTNIISRARSRGAYNSTSRGLLSRGHR
jgi:hypothetical protein